MDADIYIQEDRPPERRVAVVCPKCKRGYKVAPSLLGRRLACKECRHEWRARRNTVEEIRSSLASSRRENSSELGRSPVDSDLPPTAGGTVAIDMSWAGKHIGRYRARSLLGHGGMGVVWRAHDDSLRRDVALKILTRKRNENSPDGLNLDLFMQEARAVAKLQHPSVVSIYEVAEHEGYVFLSLELMEGGTLKEFVDRRGAVAPRTLFGWMVGPARALGLAHRRGVVHRDIKPGNLMFDDHGHLKLMDFGLADVSNEAVSERLRGKAVGSLGWVAPETAKGHATTAGSDIYSFGLVMWYALTGRPLIHGRSRSAIIALHQNPPDLKLESIKGLTPRARRLLEKCLAIDPVRRFATADEMADELQAVADEDPMERRRRRKSGVSIAVMATVIGIIAGMGLTLYYLLDLINQEREYSTPVARESAGSVATPRRLDATTASLVTPGTKSSDAVSKEISKTARGPMPPPAEATPPPVTDANRRLPWPDVIGDRPVGWVATQGGRVFHRPDGACGARNILYGNLVIFDRYDDAIASGRTPCKHCNPTRDGKSVEGTPVPHGG